MTVLAILLTALTVSSHVMTAAYNGVPVQSELVQLAVMLPQDDICNMYLDRGKVEDYNGDGVPEVYLTEGGGWHYLVCYTLDGGMRTVENLEPWAWSSDLYHTADGRLVLYTWPHTMGTDGNYNYRIYEWTEDGYCLKEDLWSEPDECDFDGTVLSCTYFYAGTAADPFLYSDKEAEEIPLTKEAYEQKIKDLGEMTSVFEDGLVWGWEFWQENDYEDESVGYGIYREIQEAVLNWQ